jgi:flavin-binding protein dodecin
MAVRKSINIAGSGPTIEASIHEAIDRAYTTLEGITRFEVTRSVADLTDSGARVRRGGHHLVHAPRADARVSRLR